jgi:hypothetical protein
MNIEQTKRMNFMIKELRKNGIVNQFADAVNIAGGLYENAMPDSRSEAIPVTAQKEAYNQANGYSQVGSEDQTVHQMMDRKIKYAKIEQEELFNQKLRQFYEHLQGIHSAYDSQIQELKAEVQRLRAGIPRQEQQMILTPQAPVQSNTPEPVIKAPVIESSPPASSKPVVSSAGSRSGDLTPNDVVLENYFYFGKR